MVRLRECTGVDRHLYEDKGGIGWGVAETTDRIKLPDVLSNYFFLFPLLQDSFRI